MMSQNLNRMPSSRKRKLLRATALLCLAVVGRISAAPAVVTVGADKPGHPISPMLYGIFFEDINCSADGGLYAELVRNRNFSDADKPVHWSVASNGGTMVSMVVDETQPISPKNTRSLRVQVVNASGRGGVANEGYWGIAVKKGESYSLSLFARSAADFKGPLLASLESVNGTVYAEERIRAVGPKWQEFKLTLKSKGTDPKARLVISTTKVGTFWLDMVSLFPKKTWKDRPNGLRPDLAEMLAGLRPAFVRFPGGCWVEGDTMSLAYRWKQTIGNLAERRTQHNIWQYEATHGLGYHEYLQLCEDLGAEPLFVINCGMSHREVVPMDQMQEFVQDALDAIEYANGPANSPWGLLRARNGHPAPFHLKYMEIGNENGGPRYHERYALFHDAIKAKYPEMQLVANEWGGSPDNRPVEILDEHYYNSPEFFINNATKYDSYARGGRKIYVGEYAVTQGCGQGNLRAAIGEAAFMTGMERNSDVVVMASYAPLFANVNYKKWNPDLINFDSSRVYGLPGYYVQKMFGENRGDNLLPVDLQVPEEAPQPKTGAIGVGTWRTEAEFRDIKVTRGDQVLFQSDFSSGSQGWRLRGGNWSVQDGALRQKSQAENIRAFVGDKSWTDYTYTLKARKISGDEGFLIPFLVQDEEVKAWWNIGGWGNTRHGIEMEGVISGDVQGRIDTDRWYDIRIDVRGTSIKCYLDDKLVHDVVFPKSKTLCASASWDKKSGEIILKVVNVSRAEQEAEVKLSGSQFRGAAKATVLTSPNGNDENTLDQPLKVSPVQSNVSCAGSSLSHRFPANSLTVFRFKTQ